MSIYYAALATSCTGSYHLVSRRAVSEAWVADFNPYCLEAMQSNMEVKLILATPGNVLSYVTKAGNAGRRASVADALDGQGPSMQVKKIAARARDMREICEAEAFFRMDSQMHMSDSNVTTVWVNTDFPERRASTFVRVEDGGIELPNRPGEYQRTNRIEDKYEKK